MVGQSLTNDWSIQVSGGDWQMDAVSDKVRGENLPKKGSLYAIQTLRSFRYKNVISSPTADFPRNPPHQMNNNRSTIDSGSNLERAGGMEGMKFSAILQHFSQAP